MIISDPEPTDVIPTTMPPMIPMARVGSGRVMTSETNRSRPLPERRSMTKRSAIAPAPMSSAAPRNTSMVFSADLASPKRCRR